MRLTGRFALAIGPALLTSCAPTPKQPAATEAVQQVRHRCVGLGFFPGTSTFADCEKEVARQRGLEATAGSAPEFYPTPGFNQVPGGQSEK